MAGSTETRRYGRPNGPDQQRRESLDPTVASIGFAHLPRDAAQLAALWRRPHAIQHLGNITPRYSGRDVQELIGGSNWYTIVARNPKGRILTTASLETFPRTHSSRLQLLATHEQALRKGIADATVDVVLAFAFGPSEEGGLDKSVVEAGIFVGIGRDSLRQPSTILLLGKDFVPQGLMSGFADSWDPNVKPHGALVPRILMRMALEKDAYLGIDVKHPEPLQERLDKMHENLAILYGRLPLSPPPQRSGSNLT